MISYKLSCSHSIPEEYFRQFNNVVRFSHNRWIEEKSVTEIERACKSLNNIELMDASMIKMAVNSAKSLKTKEKIVFGSRNLFNKLKFKKTENKDAWNQKRNPSIYLRGSSCDAGGNRKASLDLLNNKIMFKPQRGLIYEIDLKNDKRLKSLRILQDLCEDKKACFSLEIMRNDIIVIFDEAVLAEASTLKPIKNRILSFDMNPNYIGLVVMDNQTVRHKEIIDLSILNKITNKNKKLHETSEINSRIVALARHHRVELIAFENLNMKTKDHKKGKNYNRIVNNSWNRARLVQNLVKKCNIMQIKYKEIPAFYSSFVGCLMQPEEYDSIAAAMELSRRARQFLTNQSVTIFPEVDLKAITTRWKEMLGSEINDVSWKNLYDCLKKRTKLSYRKLFAIKNFDGVSFRLKSSTSGVVCHLV
jgi:hypothetical protein